MQTFLQALKTNTLETLDTKTVEKIVSEHPYFQLAKTILLKKHHQQGHYKYNSLLKNVAAHTTDREVLFDVIATTTEALIAKKTTKSVVAPISTPQETNTPKPAESPFAFTHSEKHSFHQWLQLCEPATPVTRPKTKNAQKPIQPKLNLINQFIENNPKINPIKKVSSATTQPHKKDTLNVSNELMTETLAKVYTTQKKYENAIQAYKILSLKYPEKSSLFADQIRRIKILQNI